MYYIVMDLNSNQNKISLTKAGFEPARFYPPEYSVPESGTITTRSLRHQIWKFRTALLQRQWLDFFLKGDSKRIFFKPSWSPTMKSRSRQLRLEWYLKVKFDIWQCLHFQLLLISIIKTIITNWNTFLTSYIVQLAIFTEWRNHSEFVPFKSATRWYFGSFQTCSFHTNSCFKIIGAP